MLSPKCSKAIVLLYMLTWGMGCGDSGELPTGQCHYEVVLEDACFTISLFDQLSVQVTSEDYLVRGFSLDETQTSWSDTVQAGVVQVALTYRFRTPGVAVEGVQYEVIPSEFEDTCS